MDEDDVVNLGCDLGCGCFLILIRLALFVGLVYALVHFARKFW